MHGLGCNIRVYLLFSRRLFWGGIGFYWSIGQWEMGVVLVGTHTHIERSYLLKRYTCELCVSKASTIFDVY